MEVLSSSEFQIVFQLLLAVFLGGLVGIERETQERPAGLRTNSLVCLGSTLFTIISLRAFDYLLDKPGVSLDPSRVVASIIVGVGFIGAGLIIYRRFRIEGLTTAAGIWVVAGIGAAIGSGLYFTAIFSAFLTLIILNLLRIIEEKVFGKDDQIFKSDQQDFS